MMVSTTKAHKGALRKTGKDSGKTVSTAKDARDAKEDLFNIFPFASFASFAVIFFPLVRLSAP